MLRHLISLGHLHHATLAEMARSRPASLDEPGRNSGVGAKGLAA